MDKNQGKNFTRNQRKKFTRKNLSLRNKRDRFISGYIEAKFPQAYDQANKCYDKMDAKYPTKRDLTKTLEFVHITTGCTSLSQYFHKKRAEKSRENHQEKEHGISDSMVLEIPLFNVEDSKKLGSSSQQQETSEHEVAMTISDEVYENLLQELRKDPDLYSIFNDMNMPGDDSAGSSVEQQQQHDEGNPDSLCEDIFNELNQDPDLQAILYNEQTPLERELSHLNY